MRLIISLGWCWPLSSGIGLMRSFCSCRSLLQPFGLVHFYTDAAGVYDRHLPVPAHPGGKLHPQQSDRKHLTLRPRRKRLARKPICFAQSVLRPDTVIGLFVNRSEFGTPVYTSLSTI